MAEHFKKQWWKSPPETAHNDIGAMVKKLVDDQQPRLDSLLKWFRLYGNYNSAGLGAGDYARAVGGVAHRLTLNLIQSGVDTVHAKLTKQRVKPTFLTTGGTYKQQKKAKRLDRFTQGLYAATKANMVAADCEHDSLIFGTGVMKILEDGIEETAAVERVFPAEIMVDDKEAIYGKPRSLYQRRVIDRDCLVSLFPEHEAKIRQLASLNEETASASSNGEDLVSVFEAWHLPSGKVPKITAEQREALEGLEGDALAEKQRALDMDGHDGRHAIVIDGLTLYFGPWRKKTFPFKFIHWIPPVRGFWGTGIPEQGVGIQFEVNKIALQIQRCLPYAVPRCFVMHGSKVNVAHLSDEIANVIKWAGNKPTIESASVIAPELFAHLDRLVRSFYELIGVSQLSASAKKPAGLESGAALREMNHVESERFADRYRAYEDFHMEFTEALLDVVRDIAARNNGAYKVVSNSKLFTLAIDWSEVDLEADAYVMQVFPTSALPQTPQGRMAMVEDLMRMGFLNPDQGARLLSFPDLEARNQLAEASAELTSMQLDKILEDEKPTLPHPMQDLTYAIGQAQAAYMLALTCEDVSERSLELLRNYVGHAVKQMQAGVAGAAGAAPMPGAGAPPPGAAPAGPPPAMGGAQIAA